MKENVEPWATDRGLALKFKSPYQVRNRADFLEMDHE
jgi:hypothetical protein